MPALDEPLAVPVPEKLTSAEAAPLYALLAERRGRPVALDFAQVTQLGTQSLQVLLTACAAWHRDGVAFEVRNMPAGIAETLRYCGLGPAQIGAKESRNDA